MIRLILERYISSKLIKWFNLSNENTVFHNGVLKLQNLSLTSKFFDDNSLALKIESAIIEGVTIELSNNFEGSIKIHVKGVYLYAVPTPTNPDLLEVRINLLNTLIKKFEVKLDDEREACQNKLALAVLSDKFLKMLDFEVEGVHVRFEKDKKSTIGLILSRMHLKSSNVHGHASIVSESHTQQFVKTIEVKDLVIYSQCSMEVEPYSFLSDKERIEKLKELSKKVVYSGIYESLEQLVPGSIFNQITVEFEYIRTRSKQNRLEQHHYIQGKQLSNLDAEISQEFLRHMSELKAYLIQREEEPATELKRFSVVSETVLTQFREILGLIYKKFHNEDHFQEFKVETLQFALPPETAARFFTIIEQLSPEQITENVKAVLKEQSSKKFHVLTPRFFLKFLQNTEEIEEFGNVVKNIIKDSQSVDIQSTSAVTSPEAQWHIVLKNSKTEIKYFKKQDDPSTLQIRVAFENPCLCFAGSIHQLKMSLDCSEIVLCNYLQNVVEADSPDQPQKKQLSSKPGDYKLLLQKSSILCTKVEENYGILVRISDISMERGQKDSVLKLVTSGDKNEEYQDKAPSLEAEIRMKLFASTLAKETLYRVESIKGTLNRLCVHDNEGLMVPILKSYNDVKEINVALNFLKEIWLQSQINLEINLQDITVIFKMAQIDLGLRFLNATLISEKAKTVTNASSMHLMIRPANSDINFRQISNQFEMRALYEKKEVIDSQKNETEYRYVDLKLSAMKFSIREEENDPLFQFAQSSALGTRTSIELFLQSIKKVKFNVTMEQLEFIIFDKMHYPLVRYFFEEVLSNGLWSENKTSYAEFKISNFYATFFKEHSSTLFLETRMFGRLVQPISYFIGNQNTNLVKVTDVDFESKLKQYNDNERIETVNPNLLVTVNLSNNINVKIKFMDIDILFTGDIFQRFSKYTKVVEPEIKPETANYFLRNINAYNSREFMLSVEISNCNVFVPSRYEFRGNENKVIGIRGDMWFLFHDAAAQESEIIQEKASVLCQQLAMKVQWNISRFEAYIADIEQIRSKEGNVSQQLKRNIVLPTEIMFAVTGMIKKFPSTTQLPLLEITGRFAIAKLRVQFSNEDILILSETIRKEWQSLLMLNKELVSTRIDGPKWSLVFDDLYNAFCKRSLVVEGAVDEIKIVMLKMSNRDWTPLIYIQYHGDLFKLDWTDDQLTADFRFFLKSSYFNNAKGCWEPILEKSYLALSHEGSVTGEGLQQIGVTSEFKNESVNAELSESLIEFCVSDAMIKVVTENQKFLENVFKTIGFDGISTKIKSLPELDQQQSIGYLYVLRVENYSGYSIEIEFYGGIFPEEKELDKISVSKASTDSLSRIEFKSKVDRDQSAVILEKPYVLSVSLGERLEAQQPDNPLRMNVRLIDNQENTFSALEIDAENQLSKKCVFENDQDRKQTKTVYIHIKVHGHYKTVFFYSQITVKNLLDRAIEVSIESDFEECSRELEVGDEMGIPVESLEGEIKFKFNALLNIWYHKWKIRDIIQAKPGTIKQIINEDESDCYLLQIVPDPRDFTRLTICIENQFQITNSLPVPLKLEYLLLGTEEKHQDQQELIHVVLNIGQKFSCNKFDPKKKTQLRFKLRGFRWSDPINLNKFCGPDAIETITLSDYSNTKLVLKLKYQNKWKHPNFYIYCEYCVIDQSDLDIILVKRGEKKQKQISLTPGYSKSEDPDDTDLPDLKVYLLDQKNLKNLALIKNKYTDYPTEVLPIGLLGTFQPRITIQSLNKHSVSSMIDLVLETQKIAMNKEADVYTRCTYITPSFIFVNNTSHTILLSQNIKNEDATQMAQPKDRIAIEWVGGIQGSRKCFRFTVLPKQGGYETEENLKYSWSGEVDVLSSESVDFTISDANSKKYLIFNILMESYNPNYFIILQQSQNDTLLKIQNDLEEYDLLVSQPACSKPTVFMVERGKTANFAWDIPLTEKKEVKIEFMDSKKRIYGRKDLRFDFNLLESLQESSFERENQENMNFLCNVKLVKNAKVMTVFEIKESINEIKSKLSFVKKDDGGKIRQLTIALDQIGFSFITTVNDRRIELFYASIIDFELSVELLDHTYAVQARVKFINVDTNHTACPIYPVLLTTANFEAIRDSNRYTLDISFVVQRNPQMNQVICFESFKALLHPMIFKMETDTLELLVEYILKLKECLGALRGDDQQITLKNLIQGKIDESVITEVLKDSPPKELFEWKIRRIETGKVSKMAQFSNFELYPIFVWFAFTKGPKSVTAQDAQTIWSVSLNSAPSVENLIINFKGLRLIQYYDSLSNIFSRLKRLYGQELTMSFWGWIYPTFTVKNPVEYFEKKALKAQKVLDKPAEKYLEGPLQNILYEKEKTLQRQSSNMSVTATSLARNLTKMTMGEEALFDRRADLTIKPTNIIQGISQGGRIFIKNVGRGISNLVHKPISEAKKDGIAGFFTGIAKGVGGMIVSPLSGVYDGGTKAIEGFKNTANIFGKSANTTRIRDPRVFYGPERAIKEFNKTSSHSFYILNKIVKNAVYEDLTFLGAFKVTSGDSKSGSQETLLVSLEWIICIDCANERLVWKIRPSDILKTTCRDSEVEMKLINPIKLKSTVTTNKLVFQGSTAKINKNIRLRIELTKFAY